jgi:hypothetical protein
MRQQARKRSKAQSIRRRLGQRADTDLRAVSSHQLSRVVRPSRDGTKIATPPTAILQLQRLVGNRTTHALLAQPLQRQDEGDQPEAPLPLPDLAGTTLHLDWSQLDDPAILGDQPVLLRLPDLTVPPDWSVLVEPFRQRGVPVSGREIEGILENRTAAYRTFFRLLHNRELAGWLADVSTSTAYNRALYLESPTWQEELEQKGILPEATILPVTPAIEFDLTSIILNITE